MMVLEGSRRRDYRRVRASIKSEVEIKKSETLQSRNTVTALSCIALNFVYSRSLLDEEQSGFLMVVALRCMVGPHFRYERVCKLVN